MLAVAGLLVLVPVVTNLILWLHVVPRLINADSAAFDYRFAWSPWPTRIKVSDLLVTGQDPNVEFAVGVKEAWLGLELWPLVSERTIRVSRLRGSGVSVRVLQRLQPWDVRDAKVKALPDIPGRTKPPITFAYVPPPPRTREHYDLVSVEVRDIDALADELWIDEMRYRGDMRVTGAFLLRPGLELHVGPNAAVELRGGDLGVAGTKVLTKVHGRASCETPYFDPVVPEGVAILRFFSGALAIRAELVSAEFANYFLGPAGVEVHGGAGRLSLDFAFDRGMVRPGTTLALFSRDLRVIAAKTRVDTALTVNGAVDAAGRGALRVRAEPLSLGRTHVAARFSGGELSALVTTTKPADLADPTPTLAYAATLSSLSGGLAALAPYLPSSGLLTPDSGRLTVSGDVSGTAGKPDLRATAWVRGEVAAHAEERRFSGKLDVRGKVRETRERWDLAGSKLGISDLMIAKGKDVTYGWWTYAEVLEGGATRSKAPGVALDLTGGFRDIEPLFVGFGKKLGIPGWVQSLLPLPNTAWRGHLAADARAVSVSDFRASSGTVVVLLKLTKPAGTDPSGAVKLAAGPLSYGIAFSDDQTKSELFATDAWFEKQR